MERSCTAWLRAGLCLVLPAAVAATNSGSQILLHRAVDDHLYPAWDLPAQEEPHCQALPWLIFAQHWTCQCRQPLVMTPSFDCSVTFWPAIDVVWKAQQSCSIPATAQPRVGDAASKEGAKTGGHCQWAGREPGPRPVSSNLPQDEHCQWALLCVGSPVHI